MMEAMEKIRHRHYSATGREASRREPEDLRVRIMTMEEMSAWAKDDDELLDFLRARKLLGQHKEERERILEEKRIEKVVEEWRSTAPDRNIDNENTDCPHCHDYLPLDGTTTKPDGTPVYQTRLFCCGSRVCKKCGVRMLIERNLVCMCCGGDVRCWSGGDRCESDRWLRHARAGKA
jgi:hypothetical protein